MTACTTITIGRWRTGCGALATALLLAGITVPAAGQTTSPAAAALGSTAIREADCRFLANNFKTLEVALSAVDFASTRADVLADLHANIVKLHRRRGCPSRQLVAAFKAVKAARPPETVPYPAPVQARTGGQAVRSSMSPTAPETAAETADVTTAAAVSDPAVSPGSGPRQDQVATADDALLPLPPLPKPPVPPTAGPRRARAAIQNSDRYSNRRPKMDDLIVTVRVPVRIQPDDDSNILGVLEEGSLVPVISPTPENGWLRMDVGKGRAGFVPAAAVTTRAAALETLRRRVNSAAEEGDPEAQFQAGNIAVRTDMDKAINWWRKAADAGHPGALYILGVAHVDGSIQPTDSARAVALWREAAQKGHPKAQQALAKAERLLRLTRRPMPPQASPAAATDPVAPTTAPAPAASPEPTPAPSTSAGALSPQPTPRDPDAVMPAPLSIKGAATDAAPQSPDAASFDPGLPAAVPVTSGASGSGHTNLPPPPPGVLPNE